MPQNPGLTLLCAAVLSVVACAAPAATITLSGSGELEAGYQAIATGGAPAITTGDTYVLAVPGQYTFDGQFLTDQSSLPALGTSSIGPYTFQDSYVFRIGQDAYGSTLTASLGLGDLYGIDNLQLRLYGLTGPALLPVIGSLAGQPVQVITPWTGGGSLITATFNGLGAGDYVLDIAGIASGSAGGSYVGQLNLAPVPLPAGMWLLISGLGALGGARLRRRATA